MGLYDDEKQAVTTGDVLDVIYWQAKFASLQLEAALKTRQPEGAIKLLIPGIINLCKDVLTNYPNHEEVKDWAARAAEIQKKIDPNALSDSFKSNFAEWRDYSYEAGWRSYHIAKMAVDDSDWRLALSHASEAGKQFARTVERMSEWSTDTQNWVKSARSEMQSLEEQAAGKI